jgi:hypothetical protein
VIDFSSTASVAAAKEARDADALDSRKCCKRGSVANEERKNCYQHSE